MELKSRQILPAVVLAAVLHVAVLVAAFWTPIKSGAVGTGASGLEVSLGAAGGAPGVAAPIEPDATEIDDAETTNSAEPSVLTETEATTKTVAATQPSTVAPPVVPADQATLVEAEITTVTTLANLQHDRSTEAALQNGGPPTTQTATTPVFAAVVNDAVAVEAPASKPTPFETVSNEAVTAEPVAVEAVAAKQDTVRPIATEPPVAELVGNTATPAETATVKNVVPTPVVEAMPERKTAGLPPLVPEAIEVARVDPAEITTTQETTAPIERSIPNAVAAPVPRARPKNVQTRPNGTRQPKPAEPTTKPPAQPRRSDSGREEPVRRATRTTGEAAAETQDTRGKGDAAAAGNATSAGQGSRASAGGDPGAIRDYQARIAALLERHKRYPRRAERRRQQGVGMLSFVIMKDGSIGAVRLAKSTGNTLLDDEIMSILNRIGRFPPIPDDVGMAQMPLSAPIKFEIR